MRIPKNQARRHATEVAVGDPENLGMRLPALVQCLRVCVQSVLAR